MIWIRRGLILTLLLIGLTVLTAWWWLKGSLPALDGEQQVNGLQEPVTLVRDAQGIVHIQSDDRNDIAFGLGFAHAQDRFFQMDLQRRRAAGTLSELFGARALEVDRAARLHRFSTRALDRFSQDDSVTRSLASAYSRGVNAGLESLSRPPFEYTLLGAAPQPWMPEDIYLTLYSMILLLQDSDGSRERLLGLMADVLPADVFEFLNQPGGRWDAPLNGPAFAELPVPQTGLLQLLPDTPQTTQVMFTGADELPGSNNWAVDGRFTEHGSALVADDMHLPVGVPNTWYRASWSNPQNGALISGATLPGTPFMIVGSNTSIAWGYTNTQGDWSDVVLLEVDEAQQNYRTIDGWEAFTVYPESIQVKDALPVTLNVRETRYGPVIGEDHKGRLMALRWTAHDPEGANSGLMELEHAQNVQEVVRIANQFGMPQQNLVVGDSQGNIAWVIGGPVPRRFGDTGNIPVYWDDGQSGWNGYHDNTTHPHLLSPDHGRLWTANARVMSGEAYEIMGDNGAALGARQQQIRDRLFTLESATPLDMLQIQRDNEALFLSRWQARLLALLARHAGPDQAAITAALPLVRDWSAHADRDDVGYRLVRAWRQAALERVFAPVDSILEAQLEGATLSRATRQLEYPGWQLLQDQPAAWLNPEYADWEQLELDAIVSVLEPLFEDGTLSNDSWGEINRLDIAHPLAGALPVLGNWLTMPATAMSGDSNMPFVQRPGFGASQRFAVSPGHEDEGYFHMPAGQSAHPLSPFFDLGHEDWVEGIPSPWLAGPAVHRLVLEPMPRAAD